jgi:hypothetical protein
LSPFEGDDLSFLLSGNPDPVLSREAYLAVRVRLATGNFLGAAKQLIELRRRSVSTFHSSGWVQGAIARIILNDERAGKEFVKSYWKANRKRSAEMQSRAFEALQLVQGDHLKHWIITIRWFLKFRRSYDDRAQEKRFVPDAVKEYWEQRIPCKTCLNLEATVAIAKEVFAAPDAKPHVLKDRASARLVNTSHSSLIHARASLRARKAPKLKTRHS